MKSITIKGYDDPKIPKEQLLEKFLETSWNHLEFSHIASNKIIFSTYMSIYRNNKYHIYDVKVTIPLNHPGFIDCKEFYIVPTIKDLINNDTTTYNYQGYGSYKVLLSNFD
jgi:hypothetical protein